MRKVVVNLAKHFVIEMLRMVTVEGLREIISYNDVFNV